MSEATTAGTTRYVPVTPERGVTEPVMQSFRTRTAAMRPTGANGWLTTKYKRIHQELGQFAREGRSFKLKDTERQGDCEAPADRSGLRRRLLTPLDNVLTLSKRLADNLDQRLSPRQVDYAQTIYASATELRSMIDGLLAGAEPAATALIAGRNSFAVQRTGIAGDAGDAALADDRLWQASGESLMAEIGVERVAIVEGDPRIAALILERVRDNGYEGFVASGLGALRALVRKSPPDAIILGMKLADADGWAALDALRHDPETRPIPLCMFSINGSVCYWLQIETAGIAAPPIEITEATKSRCWRDGDGDAIEAAELHSGGQLVAAPALSPKVAPSELQTIMLADEAEAAAACGSGTVHDMTRQLSVRYSDGSTDSVVLKQSGSLDAMLEGAMLFLHQAVNAPCSEKDISLECADPVLAGRKVLLIDADIRHIYAMTGALEDCGMRVVHAEDSGEALAALAREPDVDVVLLDVAMAGIEAESLIRHIRSLESFKTVPIIVLTGPDDGTGVRGTRARWLRVGASDDIARPANIEQLLSLVRAHLTMSR